MNQEDQFILLEDKISAGFALTCVAIPTPDCPTGCLHDHGRHRCEHRIRALGRVSGVAELTFLQTQGLHL